MTTSTRTDPPKSRRTHPARPADPADPAGPTRPDGLPAGEQPGRTPVPSYPRPKDVPELPEEPQPRQVGSGPNGTGGPGPSAHPEGKGPSRL
jgi:hypothetical protein